MNHLMLPPQDGRRWFPVRYLSGQLSVASSRGGEAVHDFLHGWGRFSPDRLWFSWDSGYLPWWLDPKGKKPKPIRLSRMFSKWIFPVIKNMPDTNLTELLAASSVSDASIEEGCDRPPEGWRCSRPKDHEGPCAATPKVSNEN